MTAAEFWTWFQANNKQYLFINQVDEAEKERLLNEFLRKLHEHCDALFFAIGGMPDEDQEVIITAEGNKAMFPAVEALVAAAPKMKDWRVIPFKPAMGFEFIIQHSGIAFDPSKAWFLALQAEDDPKSLGLRIAYPDYEQSSEREYLFGTYLLLDAGLGEKSATIDIDYLEVGPLPPDAAEDGFQPLNELPEFIDWWKQNIT